jgi:hypothetical protein
MSRTLSEIYDAIAAEKATMAELNDFYIHNYNPNSALDDHQTLLKDLTSSSKVAIWRLFMWIVAVAIWVHEGLWDVFRGEVDEVIANKLSHTARWYQEQSFLFQYGDQLTWTDSHYQYDKYDANKQIIKRAAAYEVNGLLKLKVATITNSKLAALDSSQLLAFQNFWSKNKDAGVFMDIISINADLLHLAYEVFYDPALLHEDGSLIADNTIFPVNNAIADYLANLDFNGKFRLEKCDAAILKAEGVVDFTRTLAQAKKENDIYKDIDISIVAYSGYFEIDPAFVLSDTITYIANV